MTSRAQTIRNALATAQGFKSAQEVYAELRRSGTGIGLTTVYRVLQKLVEDGSIDTMRLHTGESVYRVCASGEHHHHLVCRTCERAVEIVGPEIEAWADGVAAGAGFVNVSHTVEVFGTCATCSEARRRQDMPASSPQ
jgi:Fur family transcriptional regulator, ferric uptake regulator